ncbi:MAG TPA: hypothetical protein VF599_12435 [Pyrinomonadaceae bacterium]|jgi:hypothetical protein
MDVLTVELVFLDDKAEVVIGKNKQRLQDFARDAEKIQPNIKFKIPNENFIDLDRLEKKAAETRKQFQQITATRLDAGNVGGLTREIVRTSERARQLQNDISNIRKELLNPNRKSSIAFLTDELRAAEKEADNLNRKLSALPSANSSTAKGISGKSGKRGRITDFQATTLELTDDFAPEGLNRAYNAVSRGMLAVNALSMTSLGIFGAVAVAGYGIVKVTENIRNEAERRLQVEFQIQGAINNQILSQKEGLKNLQKMREEAAELRTFERFLDAGSIEALTRRRANLEQLKNLTPATLPVIENGKVISKPNEDFEKLSRQLLTLDAQIDSSQQNKIRASNEAFDNRWKSYAKSQDDAREAEQRRLKQQNESIEKGKAKVRELGKTYTDVLDNLYQKQGANNPLVSIFSDGDKALKTLRENTKGLSADLISTFETMQKNQNALKLYEARIDNNLGVFDLREQAKDLRNYQKPEFKIEDPTKFFDDFIQAGLKQIEKGRGGKNFNASFTPDGKGFLGFSQSENDPFTRYHSNIFANGKNADGSDKLFTNGFSQSDARNDLLNAYDRVSNKDGGFGGFSVRQRTFGDLSDFEKQSYIQSLQKQDDSDLRLQDRLQRQISLIQGKGFLSENEQAINDKKLIALSSGLNPSQLTYDLREKFAAARERDAVRIERYEQDATADRKKQIALQNRIAESLDKLKEIAEKEGLQGVIRIIDESNGKADVRSRSVKTPTPRHTQEYYEPNF